jgi:hypothetical protein
MAEDKRWYITVFICLNASSRFAVFKGFRPSNINFYQYSMGVLKIKHNHLHRETYHEKITY